MKLACVFLAATVLAAAPAGKTFQFVLGGAAKPGLHETAVTASTVYCDTHFNSYGAYELAECIVDGIREDRLPIARYLRSDIKHFDPAHPDPLSEFHMPMSPFIEMAKPYGN
ncbi:MAG TPA: hypothetical protein VH325_07000 [Bryobacteraceae bacterium]|jgi:hypothetical protein|nr:hypothetical protein [Bryobacteraceae bacterium]